MPRETPERTPPPLGYGRPMTGAAVEATHSDALSTLLSDQPWRRVPAGMRLYHEGDQPDGAHCVHSGLVELVRTADNGFELLLELCGPGGLVGGHSAIDGLPRFTSALALTDCWVTSVPRDRLVALARHDADLAMAMLVLFSRDVRVQTRHLLERSAGDAVALVALRLLELASDPMFESFRAIVGPSTVIDMPISQRGLASWAGVSRRSMAGALHRLRDDGIIRTSRLHVEVRDRAALADRCSVASRRSVERHRCQTDATPCHTDATGSR